MDDLVDVVGKNSKWIVCKFCQSKVLRPSTATYEEREYCVLSLPLCSVIKFVPSFHLHDQLFLPFIQKKEEFASELLQGETLTRHWLVSDMFAFENVGFSMTVGSIKYLACADCDRGPIGWHDITDNTKFYVAVERVEHIKM
ncbi:Guanine nucleotide exchange factor MSS4 [Acropora cervicornis]|uniref:Guanine nucleotide exchange factor MSS4 n=1 Tax=Acropora cervicornis TaxID=6130 RepID=A0AAD9QGI0_ACRCE|nr:Guanine nucleotide exchange factor MSS4 [Acropora cervicornis]